MKQLLLPAFLLALGVLFSCNNNNPVTPTNPGSFQGEWTVDKVQMVQAPPGGSGASMMKQALVPFGEVDGSFAGYLDFKFGAETVVGTSANVGGSGQSYFIGNTGYYMRSNSLHKSLDGGNSWSQINFSMSISSLSGFVKDANTIYITGWNSSTYILIKSTDQGASWNILNNNLQIGIGGGALNKTFCFVNNTTGFAVNYDFSLNSTVLHKTTNDGADWNTVHTFSQNQTFYEIHFDSELRGFAVSQDFLSTSHRWVFSKTNDGGLTWTNSYAPSNFYVYDYFSLNENVIWISGFNEDGKNCLYKSNDGAQTWNLATNKTPLTDIRFVNENTGYGITSDGFFVKTVNGGASWSTYSTPPDFQTGILHLFGDQPVNYNGNKFWRPTGITDTTKWTANGMITNSAIQLITRSYPFELRANGDFQTNSNSIVFTVYNYMNTHNKVGLGTFSFENNYLNVELNLPNDEKWKVKLRRK